MSTTTKRPRAKPALKPRVMWAQFELNWLFDTPEDDATDAPGKVRVLVIPLDDVDALVERTARALCKAEGLDWSQQSNPFTSGSGGDDAQGYRESARAVLTTLGVPLA